MKLIKAALMRALKTFCQSLVSNLPIGMIVTPVMIKEMGWNIMYVVIAWILTGVIAGMASLLTSVIAGLPEVKLDDELDNILDEEDDNDGCICKAD